ncbi:MBL fold metallo-hydrolase [Sorangium sp. So ce448]|uniref:MBL fold metallo-hydrolase n=1 Tax=Sorangium sp. So ce448 TaxID=3133314 RepID=UPI003F604B9C
MGRFDHLATTPARGPADVLKWKLGAREKAVADGFVTPHRTYDRSLVESGRASLTWIGHASFLLVLGGLRILIDPILATGLGTTKRLAPAGIPIEDLTEIDLVLITHNHRDHLDAPTLSRILAAHAVHPGKLGKKNASLRPRFVVPQGNGALLAKLGAGAIDELAWWQSVHVGQVEITLVPARHWSMRMPWDRNEALWGGFVIRGPEGTAYHSGDTGFFDAFAEIGARSGGSIDWAMLPIGAYAPRWFMEPQHMGPEEAVQAAELLGARTFVAMHWGTYKLTDEPIGEPPVRAREAFLKGRGDMERLWILDVGETRGL